MRRRRPPAGGVTRRSALTISTPTAADVDALPRCASTGPRARVVVDQTAAGALRVGGAARPPRSRPTAPTRSTSCECDRGGHCATSPRAELRWDGAAPAAGDDAFAPPLGMLAPATERTWPGPRRPSPARRQRSRRRLHRRRRDARRPPARAALAADRRGARPPRRQPRRRFPRRRSTARTRSASPCGRSRERASPHARPPCAAPLVDELPPAAHVDGAVRWSGGAQTLALGDRRRERRGRSRRCCSTACRSPRRRRGHGRRRGRARAARRRARRRGQRDGRRAHARRRRDAAGDRRRHGRFPGARDPRRRRGCARRRRARRGAHRRHGARDAALGRRRARRSHACPRASRSTARPSRCACSMRRRPRTRASVAATLPVRTLPVLRASSSRGAGVTGRVAGRAAGARARSGPIRRAARRGSSARSRPRASGAFARARDAAPHDALRRRGAREPGVAQGSAERVAGTLRVDGAHPRADASASAAAASSYGARFAGRGEVTRLHLLVHDVLGGRWVEACLEGGRPGVRLERDGRVHGTLRHPGERARARLDVPPRARRALEHAGRGRRRRARP